MECLLQIPCWLSGSAKRSSARFVRFPRGPQLWDRVSISTRIRDERTVPKVHVQHQSPLLRRHPAVQQNDTSVSLCHTQQDFVWEQVPPSLISLSFKRRQEVEEKAKPLYIPRPSTTRAAGICRASAGQFLQNKLFEQNVLQKGIVCRHLRHRHLLLLEFLLQVTISPHVSDDSSARL